MEVGAVAARGDGAGPDGVVAEALTLLSFFGIGGKQWIERGDDARMIEVFSVKLVHARAVEGGPKI